MTRLSVVASAVLGTVIAFVLALVGQQIGGKEGIRFLLPGFALAELLPSGLPDLLVLGCMFSINAAVWACLILLLFRTVRRALSHAA